MVEAKSWVVSFIPGLRTCSWVVAHRSWRCDIEAIEIESLWLTAEEHRCLSAKPTGVENWADGSWSARRPLEPCRRSPCRFLDAASPGTLFPVSHRRSYDIVVQGALAVKPAGQVRHLRHSTPRGYLTCFTTIPPRECAMNTIGRSFSCHVVNSSIVCGRLAGLYLGLFSFVH